MPFASSNQILWPEEVPDSYVEVYSRPEEEPFIEGMSGKVVKIRDLNQIIRDHPCENLWRSLTLYGDISKSKTIVCMPAIIDIDNESDKPLIDSFHQKTPDLQKAHELTKICLTLLSNNGPSQKIESKSYFQGIKAFTLNLSPSNQKIWNRFAMN